MRKVYMYGFHERMWHWVQALVIIGLICTGLELHFPEAVHVLGFDFSLKLHTILGFMVLINAILGFLYHIFTNEIKQYFPEPSDFITQAYKQAIYYLNGIFKGEAHPFEKTPGKKLNPLQKITYLVILNILLPLQILSGLLLWISEHRPALTEWFGGVSFNAPRSYFSRLAIHSICLNAYLSGNDGAYASFESDGNDIRLGDD
jgi:thiosulfate reductase cytochrome b subunit